jgi:hypothetical protein
MSQSPGTLPDPNQAYQHLFGNVQARVFFNTLQNYGIVPQSEKQAQWMLELGAKLDAVAEEPAVKQAEEANDPYFLANQQLDQVLQQQGLYGNVGHLKQAETEQRLDSLALQFMSDPGLYNSVLAIKVAQAEQIHADLTQQAQAAQQAPAA